METELNEQKILVVEDDPGLRSAILKELAFGGYSVIEAADGETAVDMILEQDFDLVLTDLMMKEMNGLTVIHAAKRKDPQVETILMTAYGSIESNVEAIKLDVSAYILKPFDMDGLLKKVEECLKRRNPAKVKKAIEKEPRAARMTREVATSLMLGTMLKLLLRSACDALNADGGSLVIKKEKGLFVTAIVHEFKDELMGKSVDEKEIFVQQAFQSQSPIVVGMKNNAHFCFSGFKIPREIGSALAVPVLEGQREIGLLCLSRSGDGEKFSGKDFNSALTFADGVACAVKNAEIYEELEAAYHELKSTQDRLIHSERMSAIGRVATSLAHELNNPMVSILGTTQILLREMPKDNPWCEDIRIIEQHGLICKRIIGELLGFSRFGEYSFTDTDINKTVLKVLKMATYQLSKNAVSAIEELDEGLPLARVSEPHIEQVFLNLIINAQQAMPSGGILTVRTLMKKDDGKGSILVEFEDTGTGIKKENLYKIFEPFFTTKKKGEGTGLGLSTCHDIVRKHGGEMFVKSQGEGKGATLTVKLPLQSPNIKPGGN